jgi:predicted nucleotide-binding protein
MSLPIRTVVEDVEVVCSYLAKKPTGATVAEARKVLDSKHLDGRKLSALKGWGLVEEAAGRLKVTTRGRAAVKDAAGRREALLAAVRDTGPYRAVIERAAHRREEAITATDVAAHWHEHFAEEVADSDKILNDQAVCFFQIAQGAGLGQIVVGRHGHSTRFDFDRAAAAAFVDSDGNPLSTDSESNTPDKALLNAEEEPSTVPRAEPTPPAIPSSNQPKLGQAIFVAHGKNKKPLEQLKGVLDQFKIPYRVATEEPNLGRPIGGKVREIMESCNCAILIFTADEEFKDAQGNQVWRPSENVVYELGASGYLYGNRIVIMKEDGVDFPTNFRDLGYISFAKDQLEAKTMEVLKELIGFGIVKVST